MSWYEYPHRKSLSLPGLYLYWRVAVCHEKMKNILETDKKLSGKQLNKIEKDLLIEAKQNGFSDKQIAILTSTDTLSVRNYRKELNVVPVVKQIDTLAAEYPADSWGRSRRNPS